MFFLGGGWGMPPLLGLVPCLVATTLAAKGIKGRFWPGESPREEELPLSNASSTTFNEMADPGAEVCSTILSAKGVAEIIRQQRQLAAKLSDVQQELAVTKDELRSSKTELERVCREIAEKEASFDTRWREREAKIATEQETQRQEAMTKAGDMELWQSELNKLRIEASAIRDAISRVRSRSPPGSRKRGGSQRRAKGAVGSGGEDGSASDNPSAASENATSASERETVSETEADTRVKLEKKAHKHDAGTDATAPTLLRPISTNVSSLKGVTSKSSKDARSKSSSSLRRGRTPTREMARDDLDLP